MFWVDPHVFRIFSVLNTSKIGIIGFVRTSSGAAGSARPNPNKGAPDRKNPSCTGLAVLGGGLRPGLRPWSRKGPDYGVGAGPSVRISQG